MDNASLTTLPFKRKSGRHLMTTSRGHLLAEFIYLCIKQYKNILLPMKSRINMPVPVPLFL